MKSNSMIDKLHGISTYASYIAMRIDTDEMSNDLKVP